MICHHLTICYFLFHQQKLIRWWFVKIFKYHTILLYSGYRIRNLFIINFYFLFCFIIGIVSPTHCTTDSNIIIFLNCCYYIATSIGSKRIFSQVASALFNPTCFVIFSYLFSIFCTLIFQDCRK